jgi:phospholipid/cholesterol/gamma-HCH transport system ATP-binding protein
MIEMIRADKISLAESLATASFTVYGGDMVLLVTPKYEISSFLTRVLIGLERPASGVVFLFGDDAALLSRQKMYASRQRIGTAFGSGGLISNLKVLDNLVLPLSYHQNSKCNDLEFRGMALLERLRFTGSLTALPGHLTTSQKLNVGIARAMLIDPDVMIYESPVSELTQEEMSHLCTIITEFHTEKPGRASLFITSDRDALHCMPDATVITLTKGQIV